MLLIVSASAIIIYNLVNATSLKKIYSSILITPYHWVAMSLSFAMTWWTIYFSTIHASPRATIVIFYLVLALLSSLYYKKIIQSACCIVGIVVSIYMLPELDTTTILTSLLSGLFGYGYMKYSEYYAVNNQLKASQVLAIRFYMLFALSVLYLHFSADSTLLTSAHYNLFRVILDLSILILFNLAPNYCAQKSIMAIGTNKFSQIISITPVITFLLQGLFEKKWNASILILCLAVSLLLNVISKPKQPAGLRCQSKAN